MNDAKRVPAMSAQWSDDAVEIHFANGEQIVVNVDRLSPEMQRRAMFHGIEQKLRDAGALSIQEVNGRMVRPSVAMKFDAVAAVAERLIAGEWNLPRGSGEPTGGQLYQAVCAAFPGRFPSPQDFSDWITQKAEKEGVKESAMRAKIAALHKVSDALAEIRRAKFGDGEDLLDELNG